MNNHSPNSMHNINVNNNQNYINQQQEDREGLLF